MADIATTGAPSAPGREVVVGAMMREEGCVGGDVTARVGSPHAHRRGEPDGALGDVRVVAPHRSGPTPRLDGVQPTRQAPPPLVVVTSRCVKQLGFFGSPSHAPGSEKLPIGIGGHSPPAPMVTKQPAFKDAASAAEVSRWMEMQAAVSRSTSRHSKVLESVLNPGSVPEPDAAPVNPLLPRWSRTLPPQPLRVTRNPEYESIDDPETDAALARVQAEANEEVPVGAALTEAPGDEESEAKEPMTYANRIATEFMGVDPTTGKQNRVSYDGMGGIKTHYMEIYNSVGDPKIKDVMGPLVKIARPPQSKIALGNQYTESLRGTEETRARWAEKAYVTSKQRMDAPVAAAVGEIPGVAEEKAEARRLFMDNVVATRLYYGDLFNDAGQAAVEAKLADPAVSAQEKEDILEALREVHAGVQPLRDRTVSGSVQTHRAGFRPSEQHAKRTKEIAQSIERITGGKQSERAVEARERRKREARAKAAEERARLRRTSFRRRRGETKEGKSRRRQLRPGGEGRRARSRSVAGDHRHAQRQVRRSQRLRVRQGDDGGGARVRKVRQRGRKTGEAGVLSAVWQQLAGGDEGGQAGVSQPRGTWPSCSRAPSRQT